MEMNNYQKGAMSTCLESSHNYTYMSEGLDGELGELKSKIAKLIRKEQAKVDDNHLVFLVSEEEETTIKEGIKAELGDILWFVAGFADVMGWNLEDIAQMNLDKLASRKQRGVIVGDGDNR